MLLPPLMLLLLMLMLLLLLLPTTAVRCDVLPCRRCSPWRRVHLSPPSHDADTSRIGAIPSSEASRAGFFEGRVHAVGVGCVQRGRLRRHVQHPQILDVLALEDYLLVDPRVWRNVLPPASPPFICNRPEVRGSAHGIQQGQSAHQICERAITFTPQSTRRRKAGHPSTRRPS